MNEYCGERHCIATKEPRFGGLTPVADGPAWLSDEQHSAYENYSKAYCHNINLLRCLMGSEATVA